MNTAALKVNFEILQKRMAELQEEMKKTSQDLIKASFTEFFEAYPEVATIRWTQYTPYFNDGDECTFGVNDIWFCGPISDDDGKYDEENHLHLEEPDDWYIKEAARGTRWAIDRIKAYDDLKTKYGVERLAELCNACESMKRVVGQIDDDYMKMLFGDHVRVVASKTGFDVEEYEHD